MTRLPSLGMSSPAAMGSTVTNGSGGVAREHRWMDRGGGSEEDAAQQQQEQRQQQQEQGGRGGGASRRHVAVTSATADTRHGWTPLVHSGSGAGGGAGAGERFGDGGLWDAIDTSGLGCGGTRSSWPSALLSPDGDGEPWVP